MLTWISHHLIALSIASLIVGLVSVILAVNAIILAVSARNKARRRTKVSGMVGAVPDEFERDLQSLTTQVNALTNSIHQIRSALAEKIGAPNVLRFNAFGDTGSDLSFALALVDENQTGVVISSIYGREESRTYAKPVVNGESAYPLTDEERTVIRGQSPAETANQRRHPAHA